MGVLREWTRTAAHRPLWIRVPRGEGGGSATVHWQADSARAGDASAPVSTACAGILGYLLHLDSTLARVVARHGRATYAILFAVIFAETGLIVLPFLPGQLRYWVGVLRASRDCSDWQPPVRRLGRGDG